MRTYCVMKRITGVGQIVPAGILADERRDVWVIRVRDARKQMMRDVVRKTAKKKVRNAAIGAEIFGNH